MGGKHDEQHVLDDIISLTIRTIFLLLQFLLCDAIVVISIGAGVFWMYQSVTNNLRDTYLSILVIIYFTACIFYDAIGTIFGIYICTENGVMIFRGKPTYYALYVFALIGSILHNTIGNTVIVVLDIILIIALALRQEWIEVALYSIIILIMILNTLAYALSFILRYALSSKGRSFIRATFSNYGPKILLWIGKYTCCAPCR